MRVFTSFIRSSDTLFMDASPNAREVAMQMACSVLEIPGEPILSGWYLKQVSDLGQISPSDEAALVDILKFSKLQENPLNSPRSSSLAIHNLNTGRSLLLLSRYHYVG